MLETLICLSIFGRIIAWIEDSLTNWKIKVNIQGTISNTHDLTTGCHRGSTISPAILNVLVAPTPESHSTPISAHLGLCRWPWYHTEIAQHTNSRKPLNVLDKAANTLGLYFSPSKAKTMSVSSSINSNRPIQTAHHHPKIGIRQPL